MYRSLRTIRIVIALIALAVPTLALLLGYQTVFRNMQILTALLSGSFACLIFWLLVTFVYGRIYCSTLCPLGTAMDAVAWLSRLVRRKRRDYSYRPGSPAVRVVFLVITLCLVLSGYGLLPTLLDPYSNYALMVEEFVLRPMGRAAEGLPMTLSAFAVAATVFVAVVAVSWRRGRLLCNTVCPVGTVLAAPASRSLFHVEIDPDKCIHCGECERVCKSRCVKVSDNRVDIARCVVCFDCMTVCPNDAIVYRQGRRRLGMPMMESTSGGGTQPDVSNNFQKESADETIS